MSGDKASPLVLMLTRDADGASTRYRCVQFIPTLKKNGIDVRHGTVNDDYLPTARAAQAVVIQRWRPGRLELMKLSRACDYLIYDFDDAVFLRDSGKPSWARRRAFVRTIRACAEVWAGNAFLAAAAREHHDNVHLIPTAVDERRYTYLADKPRDTFDLVWIGSSATAKYLEAILPQLEEAARQLKSIRRLRLKVVADFALSAKHLKVLTIPWTPGGEAEALRSSHVGLAPLGEDDWSKGKCGLKALQYMASQLPVIGSNAGVNREIIVEGQTGLLVGSWAAAIMALCRDTETRERMGQAGHERLRQRYSLAAVSAMMLHRLQHPGASEPAQVQPG